MSGETSVLARSDALDRSMVKPVPPRVGCSLVRTSSTTASGGASERSRRPNSSTAPAVPSTSASTPSPVFVTEPVSSSSEAVT